MSSFKQILGSSIYTAAIGHPTVWRAYSVKLKDIEVLDQPSLLSGTPPGQLLNEPLLCERDGWALFTSTVQIKDKFRDCDVLLHQPCQRIWPNWWLTPDKREDVVQDPIIYCPDCGLRLSKEAYEFFWQTYRLMNLKQGTKL